VRRAEALHGWEPEGREERERAARVLQGAAVRASGRRGAEPAGGAVEAGGAELEARGGAEAAGEAERDGQRRRSQAQQESDRIAEMEAETLSLEHVLLGGR
jgi:hypothetical protein